jgi:hypothetical protein
MEAKVADIPERRFLRVAGKLWETGEFEPAIGWETARIARRPVCAEGYSLQLLDDEGRLLLKTGVEVRVPLCRVRGARGVGGHRVNGYIPLVPNARALVFRQGARILYRTDLAPVPPQITITGVEAPGSDSVRVRWKAKHDRELRFNVVFIDAARRATPVARELTESYLTFSAADLGGGAGCSIAVLATDGLRSAMARSKPFDLPEHPPILTILAPNDGDVIAPDQPVSLHGHARDAAGRSLPDDGLVWYVDGELVARGLRIAPAGPFEPGAHRVELAYVSGEQVKARSRVQLRVPECSPEHHAWRAISASLRRPERRTADSKFIYAKA